MTTWDRQRRVRLIRTDDPYTSLRPGDEGTAWGQDSLGTILVDWDNGSNLGLVSEDRYEFID